MSKIVPILGSETRDDLMRDYPTEGNYSATATF
jgi:hypothetical protein